MIAGMTVMLTAAAEAAQEAAHSGGGLPQLNPEHFAPQLFWLAVTFVLLLVIMSKVALPRVAEVIDERRDRIKRDLEGAAKLKLDTDKALADYEKALADARSNASGIAKQTREKLAAETEAEKHRVDGELAVKIQDAEARIAATKTKALSAVGDIASETARAVVAKLIGHDVPADDVKRVLTPVAGK